MKKNHQKELVVCRILLDLKRSHPPPDTPQKKNQKTHLGDPKIYQVQGMDIPKQEVAKFSYGRFFNIINSKILSSNHS